MLCIVAGTVEVGACTCGRNGLESDSAVSYNVTFFTTELPCLKMIMVETTEVEHGIAHSSTVNSTWGEVVSKGHTR